jgi:isopenicillin N synthase-like dioxygenase
MDDNARDNMEVYTLSQDNILRIMPRLTNPEPIDSDRDDCRGLFRATFAASSVILSHLDKHFDLQPATLAARCALDKPSTTAMRLLLSAAQPVKDPRRIEIGGHTDIGISTLLFNPASRVQVLPAGSGNVNEN